MNFKTFATKLSATHILPPEPQQQEPEIAAPVTSESEKPTEGSSSAVDELRAQAEDLPDVKTELEIKEETDPERIPGETWIQRQQRLQQTDPELRKRPEFVDVSPDKSSERTMGAVAQGAQDVGRNVVVAATAMLERSERELQYQLQNQASYSDDAMMKSFSPYQVRQMAAEMGRREKERGTKFSTDEKRAFFRENALRNSMSRLSNAKEAREYIQNKLAADPLYMKSSGFLEDLARMSPQIASQIVVSLTTGGMGGMAFMGLQIAGGKYQELVAQGMDPDEAIQRGIISALVQSPLEQFGIGKATKFWKMKGPMGERLKKLAEQMGTEWLTEFLQSHADAITDSIIESKDNDKVGLLDQYWANFEQITKQGAYEGLIAAVAAGSMVSVNLMRQIHQDTARLTFEKKPLTPEHVKKVIEQAIKELNVEGKDIQDIKEYYESLVKQSEAETEAPAAETEAPATVEEPSETVEEPSEVKPAKKQLNEKDKEFLTKYKEAKAQKAKTDKEKVQTQVEEVHRYKSDVFNVTAPGDVFVDEKTDSKQQKIKLKALPKWVKKIQKKHKMRRPANLHITDTVELGRPGHDGVVRTVYSMDPKTGEMSEISTSGSGAQAVDLIGEQGAKELGFKYDKREAVIRGAVKGGIPLEKDQLVVVVDRGGWSGDYKRMDVYAHPDTFPNNRKPLPKEKRIEAGIIQPADETAVKEQRLDSVFAEYEKFAKPMRESTKHENKIERDMVTGKFLTAPELRKQMQKEGKDPNKDWIEFSKRRGYTEKQIVEFQRGLELYGQARKLGKELGIPEAEIEKIWRGIDGSDHTIKQALKKEHKDGPPMYTEQEWESLTEIGSDDGPFVEQEDADTAVNVVNDNNPADQYWFRSFDLRQNEGKDPFIYVGQAAKNPDILTEEAEKRLEEDLQIISDPTLRGEAKKRATDQLNFVKGLEYMQEVEWDIKAGSWRFQFLIDFIKEMGWDVSIAVSDPHHIKGWAKQDRGTEAPGTTKEIYKRRGATTFFPGTDIMPVRISMRLNPFALGHDGDFNTAESTVVHELNHVILRGFTGGLDSPGPMGAQTAAAMRQELQDLWDSIPEEGKLTLEQLAFEYETGSSMLTPQQRQDRMRVAQLVAHMKQPGKAEELVAYGLSDRFLAETLASITVPGVKPNTTSNVWRELLRIVSDRVFKIMRAVTGASEAGDGTVMDGILNILEKYTTGAQFDKANYSKLTNALSAIQKAETSEEVLRRRGGKITKIKPSNKEHDKLYRHYIDGLIDYNEYKNQAEYEGWKPKPEWDKQGTVVPLKSKPKQRKKLSETDKQWLEMYRKAKFEARERRAPKPKVDKNAKQRVVRKVERAKKTEKLAPGRAAVVGEYPGRGLDYMNDKQLMQQWTNAATSITKARAKGVTDVEYFEYFETRIQIIRNKLDANTATKDSVTEAKSKGATKTTVKNTIRDLETRVKDLQSTLDHYKKYRWPMKDQIRLESEIKKTKADIKSLATTGKKAPREIVVPKKSIDEKKAKQKALQQEVQKLADKYGDMTDPVTGVPTAYLRAKEATKDRELLNNALIAKAITQDEYTEMTNLVKVLRVPEGTTDEEISATKANMLRMAILNKSGNITLGKPGEIHSMIMDRVNDFDAEGGWAVVDKDGTPVKFLNRKETSAFIDSDDPKGNFGAESYQVYRELLHKGPQLSKDVIEHIVNTFTFNQHKFVFEGYYAPDAGYIPSGYSFHSEDYGSEIYGMSFAVPNLEVSTLRNKIDQMRADRNKFLAELKAETDEDFQLLDPDMEKDRKEYRKGVRPETALGKTKEWLQDAWSWRLEFPEIKKERRKNLARLTQQIRQLKKERTIQAAKAVKGLSKILEGLSKTQYEILEAFSFMMDAYEQATLNDDIRAKGGKPLRMPFNWNEKKVKIEAARLWKMVQADKKLKKAWNARIDFWNDMRYDYMEAMKNVGYNIEDRLKRQFYFRHQVLDYLKVDREAFGMRGSGGKLAVPTKASHLRKRQGGGYPMNLNYIQAEFEIMAQMLYDTKVAEAVKYLMDTYGTKNPKLIKEQGLVEFRPIRGNVLYLADSIPARIAKELAEGTISEANIKKHHLRKHMAIGGSYEGYHVPRDVMDVLNRAFDFSNQNSLTRTLKRTMRLWKQWRLIGPFSFLKYNARNLSGDGEAMFVGNPKTLASVPQALKEIWTWKRTGKPTKYIQEWIDRGGQESTLQSQEITKIVAAPQFRKLTGGKRSLNPFKAWFNGARIATDTRETLFRLAAYIHYRKDIKRHGGKPSNYGGSMMEEVDGLVDEKDKAYMLSNDLLGAYDRISVGGETIRGYIMPFWSFQELNLRRTFHFFRNAAKDDRLAGAIGRKVLGVTGVAAIKLGKTWLALMAMSTVMTVWNNMMWPDEEEKLPEDIRRRNHLILWGGKNMVYFPRLGILGDLLEWFGLDTLPNDLYDLVSKKRTWNDLKKEYTGTKQFKVVANKMVQSTAPQYKLPFELATGIKIYPEVFDPTPIIDRLEYALQQVALNSAKQVVVPKVKKPDAFTEMLANMLIYKADANRMAYINIIDKKEKFLKEQGLKGTGFISTESGKHLYYMGLAWRYGDIDAFANYLGKYVSVTMKMPNLDNVFDKMDPLNGLTEGTKEVPINYKDMFLMSLSKADLKVLGSAYQFYAEIKAGKQFMEKEK
jgi:hypothetical protein